MSTSNFSVVSSIFGFVATAISLFAFVINTCRSHLPSNKIKVLDALLDETVQFFRNAVEEGFLTEPGFVQETELHITRIKTRTYDLRSRVYKATNLHQDYAEFLRGTSTAIGTTCQSLKKLRAQVVMSSEEGRRKLMETDSVPSLTPSTLPCNLDLQHCPDWLPADKFPRPHSCPPALSARKPDNTLGMPSQKNPFYDAAQSDSDVRTADVQGCTSVVRTSVTLEPVA